MSSPDISQQPAAGGKSLPLPPIPMEMMFSSFPVDELVQNDPRYRFHSAAGITLNNDVHPTMTRARWSGVDYDAILPALQLCSLLLTSDESLRFHSAYCLSHPKTVKYADKAGTYQAIFRKPAPLSPADRRKIHDFWDAFAPYVDFAPGDMEPDTAGTSVAGKTRIPAGVFPVPARGHSSSIRINRTTYESLLELRRLYDGDPMSAKKRDRLFAGYFGLAKVLGHELAHILRGARWPLVKDFCMPFENYHVTEDGFNWEAAVFGGQVNVIGAWVNWKEHPSGWMIDTYLRAPTAGLGVTASVETITAKTCDVEWRVPRCFVRALFQKEFWGSTVPAMGPSALRLPKLLGLRLAPEGLGTCGKCYCEACFWMKEFVMRANARGNGLLTAEGRSMAKLSQLERKRIVAEKKQLNAEPSTDGEKAEGKQLKFPDRSAFFLSPNDQEDIWQPGPACIRGRWRVWNRPRSADDTRELHSFGLPEGFKSCLDGTVVADEHFGLVTAAELSRWGLLEIMVSPLRAEKDQMDDDDRNGQLIARYLADVDPEELVSMGKEQRAVLLRERVGRAIVRRICALEHRMKPWGKDDGR